MTLFDWYVLGANATLWIQVFAWVFDPYDRKRSGHPPVTIRRVLISTAIWPVAWPYGWLKAYRDRKWVA